MNPFRARSFRRSLAVLAVSVGALAAPTSAMAAMDIQLVPDGVTTAGAYRTYTATITNQPGVEPDPWTQAGTVTITPPGTSGVRDLTLVGPNTLEAAITGTDRLAIPAGSVDGDVATVTFRVRAIFENVFSGFDPATYPMQTLMTGTSADSGTEWSGPGFDTFNAVPSGGPSLVVAQVNNVVPSSGVPDRWAQLGSTAAATLTVRNLGTGAANAVRLTLSAPGTAAREYSPEGPLPATPFAPALIIGAGCTPIAPGSKTCEIDTVPVGGVVNVPLSISGLTHYGSFVVRAQVLGKADVGNPGVTGGYADNAPVGSRDSERIAITDGGVASSLISSFGPRNANGNTELGYRTEVVNDSAQPLRNAIVRVSATTFDTTGAPVTDSDLIGGFLFSFPSVDANGNLQIPPKVVGDPKLVQSLRRVTLSNGAACANSVESYLDGGTWKQRTLIDRWDCPIGQLAAGQRLTVDIAANFATNIRSETPTPGSAQITATTLASVGVRLLSTTYQPMTTTFSIENSSVARTVLNGTHPVDLSLGVTSAAAVGAGRLVTQRLTVTNKGALRTSESVLSGDVLSSLGAIETAALPGNCVGGTRRAGHPPLICRIAALAPGASTTIDIPVRAGATLGTLVTSYGIGSPDLDTNDEDNQAAHSVEVVAPKSLPLVGVKVAKPKAIKAAALNRFGIATRVQVPGAASVKVDLYVSAATARTLGLRARPRKGKVASTADLRVGTATVRTTKAGTVTVSTKVTFKYRAKLLAAKGKVALKRTVTVISTAGETADASATTTQTVVVTPKPKVRVRKR